VPFFYLSQVDTDASLIFATGGKVKPIACQIVQQNYRDEE